VLVIASTFKEEMATPAKGRRFNALACLVKAARAVEDASDALCSIHTTAFTLAMEHGNAKGCADLLKRYLWTRLFCVGLWRNVFTPAYPSCMSFAV
jgi:hypothetical protein